MKAELNFKTREEASKFAQAWIFFSKTGYVMNSGKKNVKVTVFDVDEKKANWINQYVENTNTPT